jgi:hypothetical protein
MRPGGAIGRRRSRRCNTLPRASSHRRLRSNCRPKRNSIANEAIEAALGGDSDRYLLVARTQDDRDATLALILAFDRDDHLTFQERILKRCVEMANGSLDDLA